MTETIPKPTDIDNGVPTPDATQLEEMFNQPTEGNEDSIDTTPQREPAESRIGNLLRRLAKGADTADADAVRTYNGPNATQGFCRDR